MQCALTVETCLRLCFGVHHPVMDKLHYNSLSSCGMMKDTLTVLLMCMNPAVECFTVTQNKCSPFCFAVSPGVVLQRADSLTLFNWIP